ncbi:glycogen/starch/alpha-glucan phosphorylase [Orrella sp. JC864]|uniref:glycogen/starch/alpha-glucan phosphorylase n=1 Tax=Orrella sp. JC864 TaxID=3120298 RepID=UPI00300A981F
MVVRRRLVDILLSTQARRRGARCKKVYYLSLEFLVGRSLVSNLLSLGLLEGTRQALAELGLDLDALAEREHDAALGNGGLGRLAACFMESLATLDLPALGCGIKYDYGLFKQAFDGPSQVELPDFWDGDRSPWMIERHDESHAVPLYGHVEHEYDEHGRYRPRWHAASELVGIPHDMPVAGYGGACANVLRLYAARASATFDMHVFNSGDYMRAVQQKIESETVSKVLYPSDAVHQGRELRLVQEYFLVACALRDIMGEFLQDEHDFARFPERVAIQMNDTHPALAVAELMRLLVDEHDVPWTQAWDITQRSCGYTNHTLLPEALEKWPVALLERVLPRHMQIIYEINARFLAQARVRWGEHDPRIARVSLIEEGGERQVRMAHLAIVGSHSVNGVAQLHSELVKRELVPELHALMPGRFNNKTNGIAPRRWLLQANPALAALLDEALGTGWVTRLETLQGLERHAGDAAFIERLQRVKRGNKQRLAQYVRATSGQALDPDSLYDVQVKRMHEYKRQLLHILHVIHLHIRLTEHGQDIAPRTHIFAGKAAPGYAAAKRIIHLIRSVAAAVNADPRCRGRLSVVFLPDYKVSLAERIIPAADLSEQISTAGTEASGTGNMKLALNGALTMGTLDGANIEIRDCVGAENFYAFGLDAAQAAALRAGGYRPRDYLLRDPELARVLDALIDGRYAADRGTYAELHRNLVEHDHYLHLADFRPYLHAQRQAARDFQQPRQWHERALYNMARLGHFSSDRTVAEYAGQIWGLYAWPQAMPQPKGLAHPRTADAA